MSKRCRVCKRKFISNPNAKSCGKCRDFEKIAKNIFNNPKRKKKVDLNDFPDVGALARHLKYLYKKQNGKCEYTNYDMMLPYSNPGYKNTGTICSPDRKDPRGKYSKSNIVLTLSRINIMKNDIESEMDFYEICKSVVNYFEVKYSGPNYINLNK